MHSISIDLSYNDVLDNVLEQNPAATSAINQFTFHYGLNYADAAVLNNILKTIYLLGANKINAQFKAQHDALYSQVLTSSIQQQHSTYWSRLQSLMILTQGLNQLSETSIVALLQGLQREFDPKEVIKLPNDYLFSFQLFSLLVELYCGRYQIGEYCLSTEHDVAVALVEDFKLQKIQEATYLTLISEVVDAIKILLPGRGDVLGRSLREVVQLAIPRSKPTSVELPSEITKLYENWLYAVNRAVQIRLETLRREGRAHREDKKFSQLFILKGSLEAIGARRMSLSHKLDAALRLITEETKKVISSKQVQASLLKLIANYHEKFKFGVDEFVSLPVVPKPFHVDRDFAQKIISKVFVPSAKSCPADPRFATTVYSFKDNFWTSSELEPSMQIFFTVNALYHLGVLRIDGRPMLEDSYRTLVDEKLKGFFILNYGLHQVHRSAIAELQSKLSAQNVVETYTLPNLICLEGTDFLLNLITIYCSRNQLPASVAPHQALERLGLQSTNLVAVMPMNERTIFGTMQVTPLVEPSMPAAAAHSQSVELATPQLPTATLPAISLAAQVPISDMQLAAAATETLPNPDLIAKRTVWVKQPYALLKDFKPVCAVGDHKKFFDEVETKIKTIVEGKRYLATDISWVTSLYDSLQPYALSPVASKIKKSTGLFSSLTFAAALTAVLNQYPLE